VSKKTAITRRSFIRRGATLTAAGAVVPYWFTGENARAQQSTSKNDRPLVAVVGTGGQGSGDMRGAAPFGDVVAVCDVDENQARKAAAMLGGKPTIYGDYRKLLERNDIEVIINGTPDHWHTAINIAACKAGKDVYAEKPMTLTIDEGKLLSKVVKQTGRVVQVGTQQRSAGQFQLAIELVRNGRVGNLKQIWVALPNFSTKGGPFAAEKVPDNLNWDMYQGQAPAKKYCSQRTHRNFRWWYEYAGGIITDWGNHHMDIAQWGADCELSGPTSIDARGLFPNHGKADCFNTPNRFFSRMTYPNGVEVLFFSSLKCRKRYGGVVEAHEETSPKDLAYLFGKNCPEEIKTFDRDGIMFIGDKGRVFVNRGGVYGKPVEQLKDNPLPEDAWRVRPSGNHIGNLFECVKTRQEPVSPVRIEHRTITACHLTNISIRLKRKLTWNPVSQEIVGDDEANAWQKRQQRKPFTFEA
jgi:myo-inositol 2-dehydrogenase/D-chiro-inositol 1-dehydrogenase